MTNLCIDNETLKNVLSPRKLRAHARKLKDSFATSISVDDLDPFVEFTPNTASLNS